MRNIIHARFILVIFGILVAGIFLASCNLSPQTPTITPTEIVILPTVTQTAAPTETPQPPLVVLLAPISSDQNLADHLKTLLSELATQADLRFQVEQTLSADDFNANDIKVIFVLPPDPGVSAMAAESPQTQFVAVGISGLQSGANINLVGSSTSRPDQVGFMAGIIAATTTKDFRVGVIYPAETALGKAARRGFSKGVSFYCGMCQPVHPPYPPSNYPIFYELPSSAAQSDWDAAVAYFNDWMVETIYITPDLSDPGLGEYLAKAGFHIIDHGSSGGVQDQWTASIGAGDIIQVIRTHWQDFISGHGGLTIEMPFTVNYSSRVSPGKQHFIDLILSDLLDGFIDTGVDPVSGEWR